MHRLNCLLGMLVTVGACATEGKGAELVGADGKEDSFVNPTDHGPILDWSEMQSAEIKRSEMFHQWEFYLSGPATVTLRTQAPRATDPEIDTVMYLYRRNSQGTWGRFIAKNDDYRGSVWSRIRITNEMGPGEYAIRVKPYNRSELGKFALATECEGAGCERAPVSSQICEILSDYVVDVCLPDDDEEVDFEPCMMEVDYGDVTGDHRPSARDCCRGDQDLWCDQFQPAILAAVELPADVAEAVRVNYEIGRHQWDSGGTSSVQHYRVTNGDPNNLVDMIAAAIMQTQSEQAGFAAYCRETAELAPDPRGTSTRVQCAMHLAETNVNHRFLGATEDLGGSEDERRYEEASRTIHEFVSGVVGEGYIEVNTEVNIWSVDVGMSLLIKRDFSEVVIATYDYGA